MATSSSKDEFVHMGDRDHLLGIGGVGMSALAQALIDAGRTVTGADRLVDGGGTTPVLEALRQQDMVPYITVEGTKGGSPIAAAAINAIMYLIDDTRP